jgi:hypothetical protein
VITNNQYNWVPTVSFFLLGIPSGVECKREVTQSNQEWIRTQQIGLRMEKVWISPVKSRCSGFRNQMTEPPYIEALLGCDINEKGNTVSCLSKDERSSTIPQLIAP